MAQKFLTAIDLTGQQLLNVVLQNLASAPATPAPGRIYYDTTLFTARQWNGTVWVAFDATKAAVGTIPLNTLVTDPLARANHTGTQLASTISNFAATAQAYTLNQFASPTASLNFGGFEGLNIGTPTAGTSITNKTYVDNAVANSRAGLDVKDSVRVATTAQTTLTGTQTIDGVAVVVGDRVLVRAQTLPAENGIYIVAAGGWSRSSDAVTGTLTSEAFAFVEEGTVYGAAQFRVTTTGAITVGTTAITWAQFGAGTGYSAGNGLLLTGSVFSVVAGAGILVGAAVAIDTSVVVRKFASTITGDNTTTSFAVTHNLNNSSPEVMVYENATNALVFTDVTATSANVVTIVFGTAPATGLVYRIGTQG